MTGILKRTIRSATLEVTELGFGSASLGNLYQAISDAEAHATVAAALAGGIAHFDTAPHYGRGLSERRLGDALRENAEVIVSTKVGRLMAPCAVSGGDPLDGFVSPMPFRMTYDYSHDGILRSHEHSLQRLGLSRIDILYVHDIGTLTHGVDNTIHWEQLTAGGGFKALQRLRESGAVGAIGLGVNEIAVCLDAMDAVPLDVILIAGRYTLLEQEALDALMPSCKARSIALVVGGPYNSGILAGGTRTPSTARYDYAPAPQHVIERVKKIETVALRHDVALPAAALAFVLAHPQVVSVIPGLCSAEQVQQTLKFYHMPISPDFWMELRAEGLVRPDAPVPGDIA